MKSLNPNEKYKSTHSHHIYHPAYQFAQGVAWPESTMPTGRRWRPWHVPWSVWRRATASGCLLPGRFGRERRKRFCSCGVGRREGCRLTSFESAPPSGQEDHQFIKYIITWTYRQRDQVGRFFKVLWNKISYISSPNICLLCAILK